MARSRSISVSVSILMALSLCLFASEGYTQTPEATISGIVSDETGAALPGVTITAVHADTGQRVVALSNQNGFYALRPLPIGNYVVEAELQGFRTYRREGLTLTTGATVALDIPLAVGLMTETVTVTGEAPLLSTRTSEISQLIESRAVESMPLGDRRAMNLIRMTGAAVFVAYDSGAKPNFSLAGGRTQSQMFWIDGGAGQNMRLGIGQVDVDPPVETRQLHAYIRCGGGQRAAVHLCQPHQPRAVARPRRRVADPSGIAGRVRRGVPALQHRGHRGARREHPRAPPVPDSATPDRQ